MPGVFPCESLEQLLRKGTSENSETSDLVREGGSPCGEADPGATEAREPGLACGRFRALGLRLYPNHKAEPETSSPHSSLLLACFLSAGLRRGLPLPLRSSASALALSLSLSPLPSQLSPLPSLFSPLTLPPSPSPSLSSSSGNPNPNPPSPSLSLSLSPPPSLLVAYHGSTQFTRMHACKDCYVFCYDFERGVSHRDSCVGTTSNTAVCIELYCNQQRANRHRLSLPVSVPSCPVNLMV